jgi:hypothetical protein
MKNKKIKLLSLFALITGIAATSAFLVVNPNQFDLIKAQSSQTWYHYSATHATSTYGNKEYWTNCAGMTQLTAPEGVDIVEKGQGNPEEIISQYSVFDERIVNRFGSDNKYQMTNVLGKDIVVDGLKDSAYNHKTELRKNVWNRDNFEISADVYVAYDESFLYLFADVKDSTPSYRDLTTVNHDWWTTFNDSLEIRIDLLHDNSKANGNWGEAWGGDYRGDAMCEALFKVAAGWDNTNPANTAIYGQQFLDGVGCEYDWGYWWSNACRNDGKTQIISKIIEGGYTMEMRIDLGKGEIQDATRPHLTSEIGIGLKFYSTSNVIGGQDTILILEDISDAMGNGPRWCSTFKTEN